MSYTMNLEASAVRHFRDGDALRAVRSSQHAGYHFGFAAECAIKSILFKHGIPRSEQRREDPFWAHFPTLRTLLIRDGKGRLPRNLYDVVAHASFMQNWNTDIRYAEDQSVSAERADLWREQANRVFGLVFF